MKTIFLVFAFVLAISFAEEASEAGQKYDAALDELHELHKQMESGATEELEKQYDEKYGEVLKLQGEWAKEQLAAASDEDKPFFEKSLELNSVSQQLHSDRDNAELIAAYDKLLAELNEIGPK